MNFVLLSIAVLLRIFSNSFANVFQKKLTQNGYNPLTVNALTYILLSFACVLFILLKNIVVLSNKFWLFATVVGVFGTMGNGFLVKALEKGELSVLGPINAYKSVVALFFGIFFLKEMPSFVAIWGIIFIILGSYFVLDTMEERFSIRLLFNKQIQYRFLALLFTATEAVFIKKLVLCSSVYTAFVAWAVFGALFSCVLLNLYKVNLLQDLKKTKLSAVKQFLAILLCIGLMQYTTNFVFSRMNVSYALALFQLSAVISVIFGAGFFKEKDFGKKLSGAIVMILGAVLIIVYN